MNTLSDFKTKNPQYKDVPDGQLADALHDKYYSQIPKDQYYAKIGYDPHADAAQADAVKDVSKTDNGEMELYQGATFGYGDELDSLASRPVTMVKNLMTEAMGKKPAYTSDQYAKALETAERDKLSAIESKYPVSSAITNAGGQVLSTLAGGKALGALGMGAKAAQGASVANKGLELATGVGKTALIGGALNAADASGRATGGVGDRAKAAVGAFLPGALLGGGLHLGGAALGPIAGTVDRLTGHVMSEGLRSAEDSTRKFLNMPASAKPRPTQVAAAKRLMQGVDPKAADAKIAAENTKRASVGAPDAKAYSSDIATQRMRGTMKTAASRLEDDSRLTQERKGVEGDLGAKTRDRTQKAMPSTIKPDEEAAHRASRLKRERHAEATKDYDPHYRKEVEPHESVMSVLKSPVGQSAMKAYRQEAEMMSHDLDPAKAEIGKRAMTDIDSIRQYYDDVQAREAALKAQAENPMGIPDVQPSKDTMDMVDKLRAQGTKRGDAMAQTVLDAHGFKPVEVPPEPSKPKVTLRTLDEMRQFTNRESQKPFGGNESMQGAYGGLSQVLDQHLAEPLADARAAYHQKSIAIDAAEMGGDLFNKTPAEVAHSLTERTGTPATDIAQLPPEAQDSLRVVARDQIVGAIKTPEKSAALLSKIATDEKAQTMLKTLFGDKQAQAYIDASKIMLDDARAIDSVSPSDKPIQEDQAGDTLKKTGHAITWMHKAPEIIASWALKHGLTMSTEEAKAVEELGLGKPEALVKIVKENPDKPFSTMLYTLMGRMILTQNAMANSGDSAQLEPELTQ